MQRLLLVLFSGLLFSIARALTTAEGCVNGIWASLDLFPFAGAEEGDYWYNICQNNLTVDSLWTATYLYCTEEETQAGIDLLSGYCTEYGNTTLYPYDEVVPMLTEEYIASLQVVEITDANATKVWDHVILISRTLYLTGRRTDESFYRQYERHQKYGWAVFVFWGIVLSIGVLDRLISRWTTRTRSREISDLESRSPASKSKSSSSNFVSATYQWFRTNLILPAALGSYHRRLWYGCTIPTRMETVVIVAFYIVNLGISGCSYEVFYPNVYWTTAQQGWRYVADRTGIICYVNLPFLWLFAGRNNIFIWLTGWSYATFTIFHRHIARIATIQAIIHSICYSVLYSEGGYLVDEWKEKWFYMGGVATIAMSLLLVMSASLVRRHSYEIFLITHIGMAAVTLAGLFYHTGWVENEWMYYLWVPVGIWLFDRLLRFVRLLYCNVHVRLSHSPTTTHAAVSYHEEGDFIRLEVLAGGKRLKAAPGQHYFIYQPNKLKLWENHPFTLASWVDTSVMSNITNDSEVSSIEPKEVLVDKIVEAGSYQIAMKSDQSSDSEHVKGTPRTTSVSGARSSQQQLTFFLRPFSSWTKRLKNECLKSGSFTPMIAIEGPYGHASPAHLFENIVLVAGGTGISGVIPYLITYLAQKAAGKTKTRQISLVWATKQPGMISNVIEHELQPYLHRPEIQMCLHATNKVFTANAEDAKQADFSVRTPLAEIHPGRPDITEKIREVVMESKAAGTTDNRVAVLVCGPSGMADEARAIVHTLVKTEGCSIDYIEEAFGW